jgi:hypothetical protein
MKARLMGLGSWVVPGALAAVIAGWGAGVLLRGNRVRCPIEETGAFCVGATWPAGAANRYLFSSGLQIAARIPADAGFAWAGDTVGAFFADARGTQHHGTALSPPRDSRALPFLRWPPDALVRPGFPFDPVFAGRRAVSEQDVTVRFWDGDPTRLSGRRHPMGVAVDVRAMAWPYPVGNDDVVYFVLDVYNVSAADAAAYVGLDAATASAMAEIGRRFQRGVETALGVSLPDAGYRLDSLYLGLHVDPDVEDASQNYSTAILPFDAAAGYKSNFTASGWRLPAEVHGPPFAPAPGFAGAAFLATPGGDATGLAPHVTMFTNFTGSATGFPDPVGVVQLWRVLSGNVSTSAGDNPCTVPSPVLHRLCFLTSVARDTRFTVSSGPVSLEPGARATFVVAYPFAGAVASAVTIGQDVPPGMPPQPDSLVLGTDTVRTIDRALGWVSHADRDGNGVIAASEVETVPRSFLHKVQVARAVTNAGFRLAAPPEPPVFHLVPGDGKVTVVWEPSATETLGDPYHASASDPTSPLFDPSFRRFDVEGYRVYRGRSPGSLSLMAQFDHDGTTFEDRTGILDYGSCAPELGMLAQCPVAFPYRYAADGPAHIVGLEGLIVQVRPGDRTMLPDGNLIVLRADTVPALADTRVPFAFVDEGLTNGVTYWYAVTAFDVNSAYSSPVSLESSALPRAAAPRGSAAGIVGPVVTERVIGDDGEALNLWARWPRIDPTTGTFSGNIPPGAGMRLTLPSPVPEALPRGDISVQVDSVTSTWLGPTYHVRLRAGDREIRRQWFMTGSALYLTTSGRRFSFVEPLVPFDSAYAARVGLGAGDTTHLMDLQISGTALPYGMTSPGVARVGARTWGDATRYLAHSRWFAEGGAEPADPTITAFPHGRHHAGSLPGVTRIWSPATSRAPTDVVSWFGFRTFEGAAVEVWYPADFVVTWQAGGRLAVRDVTHRVDLPFAAGGGTGWGFLNLAPVLATGIDQATWDARVADDVGSPAHDVLNYQHLYLTRPTCSAWLDLAEYCVDLAAAAALQPLDFDTDGVADGAGIVLIVNGEPFLMEMAALPVPGTQWHLRAVTGVMTAECAPALGPDMTDCSDYTFEPHPVRSSNVPGQRFVLTVDPAYSVDPDAPADLSRVHALPDPYYVTHELEVDGRPRLRFVNLPPRAIVRIYSLSGVLLRTLEHNDVDGGGEVAWDLRTRNGQPVASGVYFFHVETPSGQQRIGRFTILSAGR